MPNYRSPAMCGGCKHFSEVGKICTYTGEKYKDWTYIFYKVERTRYPNVMAVYGTGKCWRKLEAMKVSKEKTGSEGNWEQYMARVI